MNTKSPPSDPKLLFEHLARETWERLALSWEYGISQGEETITDLLQLEIARFGQPHICVLKTTKAFEAQSGIDWEWWIGSDSFGWLRLAIQAKKMAVNGRYEALKHSVKLPDGGERLQHDLLKEYARVHNAIPLYCLFNRVRPRVEQPKYWHCQGSFEPEQWGCTLVPVSRVEEAINNRGCRTFDFIHRDPNTFPWRCLFCSKCPGLPSLLRSSAAITGAPPRLFRHLPPMLARARATDGVVRPEEEVFYEGTEDNDSILLVFPRRILLIEIDPSDILGRITDLTYWEG